MQKSLSITEFLLLFLAIGLFFIYGCKIPTEPTKPELTYKTNVTIAGATVLPDAYSSETYKATIIGKGGTPPYTCKQVGDTSIGGTLTISKDCVIEGVAPTVFETKIFPFKVNLTDSKGITTTLDMTLKVRIPPPTFTLRDKLEKTAFTGKSYEYDFCNPPGQINCGKPIMKEGKAQLQLNPVGGVPPYTFTIRGQPLGLIMSINGVLSGKLSEHITPQDYPIEVCAKDTRGEQACAKSILSVEEEKEPEPICPSPLMTFKACKGPCQEYGGSCRYKRKGTDLLTQCFACVVPPCPTGETHDYENCKKQCPSKKGGRCVKTRIVGKLPCYECRIYKCPKGTIRDRKQCEEVCKKECMIAAEEHGFKCWTCKISCDELCKSKGLSNKPVSISYDINSLLSKYTCVTSLSIKMQSDMKIGNCQCYGKPRVVIGDPLYCKNTPCGDVRCGTSTSCGEGVGVICSWEGWKQVGKYEYVPAADYGY